MLAQEVTAAEVAPLTVKMILPNKQAIAETSPRPGLLSAKNKICQGPENLVFNCFLRKSTTSRLTRRFVLLNIKNVYLPKTSAGLLLTFIKRSINQDLFFGLVPGAALNSDLV